MFKLTQYLRRKGFITEGYDPETDAWVLRVNIGSFSLVKTVRNFADPHPTYVEVKSVDSYPAKFRVARLGMKPMYFGSSKDLASRLMEVFDRDGFDAYPHLPLVIYNRVSGRYILLSPDRLAMLDRRKKPYVIPKRSLAKAIKRLGKKKVKAILSASSETVAKPAKAEPMVEEPKILLLPPPLPAVEEPSVVSAVSVPQVDPPTKEVKSEGSPGASKRKRRRNKGKAQVLEAEARVATG